MLGVHPVQHMDALNPPESAEDQRSDAVISFSHFLPRPELLPEKRLLFFPPVAKAVGSNYLRARVARLKPDLHLFGHTHYGWSTELDGTKYIQACVAYPKERNERKMTVTMSVRNEETEEKTLGISGSGCPPRLGHPLLVYDGPKKRFPQYRAFWSDYYETRPRHPSNTAWIYSDEGELKGVPKTERLASILEMNTAKGRDIVDAESLAGHIREQNDVKLWLAGYDNNRVN